MTPAEEIVIAGFARADFEPVIQRPLEDVIYFAASGAVADAGTSIKEIDAVSMASSDLLDGRAISTMTLTGSTGSFQKSEMRVCSDGLAALALAIAECRAGLAERVLGGDRDAVESYIRFLSAGSSLYPLDALRMAGVDMSSPEPVNKAFQVMAGYVERLERLLAAKGAVAAS